MVDFMTIENKRHEKQEGFSYQADFVLLLSDMRRGEVGDCNSKFA